MLLMGILSLTALVGFVALAVDFGHIQVAKNELRIVCDSAARAAAQCLGSSTTPQSTQVANATAAAIAVASQNTVDGQPVILLGSDVVIGNYDATQSPAFSSARTPYNAAQVTAHRDSSRGNPLMLSLASVVGVTSVNLSNSAIAMMPPKPSTYGIAGINHVSFASLGVVSAVTGNIVSNGTISIGMPLGVGVSVTGNVESYGGSVSKGTLAAIGGSTAPLSQSLYYPSVTLPTSYSNANIAQYLDSNSNFTAVALADIPAGTYVVKDLNFLAGLIVNLHGPTTFYVTGNFNMAATVNLLNLLNTDPNNLNVMVLPGGQVNFVASLLSPLSMNLYAPDTAVNITITVNHYTGCLICKTLDVNVPVLSNFTEGPPPTSMTQTQLVQ